MSRPDKTSRPVKRDPKANRLVIVRLTIDEAEAYEFAADNVLDEPIGLANVFGDDHPLRLGRRALAALRAAEKIRAAIREAKSNKDRRSSRQPRYEDGTK